MLRRSENVPLLMCQHVTAGLLLLALDELDISQHTVLCISLGKLVRGDGIAMQAGQRDQLQDKSSPEYESISTLLCRDSKEAHPSFAKSQTKFFRSVSVGAGES